MFPPAALHTMHASNSNVFLLTFTVLPPCKYDSLLHVRQPHLVEHCSFYLLKESPTGVGDGLPVRAPLGLRPVRCTGLRLLIYRAPQHFQHRCRIVILSKQRRQHQREQNVAEILRRKRLVERILPNPRIVLQNSN